jgi:hypothetical protein
MELIYRDYKIDVHRDCSLGGDSYLYYSIYSVEDSNKPCLADSFTTGSDSIKEYIGYMKARVDDYYNNPQDYEWNDGV